MRLVGPAKNSSLINAIVYCQLLLLVAYIFIDCEPYGGHSLDKYNGLEWWIEYLPKRVLLSGFSFHNMVLDAACCCVRY